MTNNKEVKEKQFAVKLTWPQVWIVLTTAVTILGTSFGVGIKVQSEVGKVELSKNQQKCLEEINKKDLQLFEIGRKFKESEENSLFYQHRYLFWQQRYQELIDKKKKKLGIKITPKPDDKIEDKQIKVDK